MVEYPSMNNTGTDLADYEQTVAKFLAVLVFWLRAETVLAHCHGDGAHNIRHQRKGFK